jgi:spermidine synthase
VADSIPESNVSPPKASFALLSIVFLVALCGLGYELLAGAVSSYFLGNTILQFSVTIGVFLSAMGLGAHLSEKVQDDILQTFLSAEIALALIGGFCSTIFFLTYTYLPDYFYLTFFGTLIILGTLTGLEIPLLIRLFKEYGGWTHSLARVLSIDYLGALVASLIFPLLLLPFLGLMRSSFFFGILNLLGAVWFVMLFRPKLPKPKPYEAAVIATGVLLMGGMVGSTRLVHFFESRMYTDHILTTQQTPYQRLVMTRYKEDLRLFIDGNLQFCSLDEYRYHEVLVHPALYLSGGGSKVLILGGGDGLGVRELVKYKSVSEITLVDLDPAVVELARTNVHLKVLNGDALSDPRVTVINDDAFGFLEENQDFYDLILVDLPDPHGVPLAKLYSKQFYQLLSRRLTSRGVMCIQATSPFFARRTFWCIARTVQAAGLVSTPIHVQVPSFGEWGFIIATLRPVDTTNIPAPDVETRYLNENSMRAIFEFGEDMETIPVQESTLDNPTVLQYYQDDWGRWH